MSKPKDVQSGRCRYCRCTDMRACDDGCSWADEAHTVCSTPDCLRRAHKNKVPLFNWAMKIATFLARGAAA